MRTKALFKTLRPAAILLTLLLTAAPLHASVYDYDLDCDYDAKVDGIYYDFDEGDKTACVTYRYKSSSNKSVYTGSVAIPSTVKYKNTTYIVTSIGSYAFYYCSDLTEVTIPNTVTIIGNYAFRECSSLTAVTIPESVIGIGQYAFAGCTSLEEVTIPNSVTEIGRNVFGGCTSLKEATIGNSVTEIGEQAFYNCHKLTSVNIPEGVTSIEDLMFYGCNSLTEITIPASVKYIDEGAFSGCSSLASIDIPEGVKRIEEKAFASCSALKSICIPDSVTSIGTSAFDSCEGLESVIIGSSVKTIRDYAFWFCSNLSSVTSLNPEPPTCYDDVFGYVDTSTCTLYVPEGSMEAYASADGWKDFLNIKEGMPEEKTGNDEGEDKGDDGEDITPEVESCATPSIGYEEQHLVFSCETEGAEYHVSITCDDVCEDSISSDGYLDLSASYNISVYATADGYARSETATAKLYFFGSTEEDEDETTIIVPTEAIGVVVTTDGSNVTVSGLQDGEQVEAYTISGIKLGTATASGGSASVNVGNTTGVVILRLGKQAIKVKL